MLSLLKKKYYLVLIVGLCTSFPTLAKTLRVASTSVYQSLDPMISYDWLGYQTFAHVCANIVSLKIQGHGITHQLDVATTLTYKNNHKTLVFTLAKGRKFHDGSEITAYDVEFSLNRVTNPALHSPGANFFKNIVGYSEYREGRSNKLSGIKVISKYLIEIDLTRPSHSFLFSLATNFGCILPQNTTMQPITKPFISSGPYHFSSLKNNVLLLERFKDYKYKFLISQYDSIKIKTSVSSDDVLTGYANKEYDIIIDGLTWTTIDNFSLKRNSNKKKENFSHGTTYLTMNTQFPPFNDKRVRKAVNYAINRDKLIDIMAGAATKTTHIPPPSFEEFHRLPNIYDYSPKKAKELLSKVRKNNKSVIKANLYAIDTKLYRKLVQSIITDLQKVGIFITPYFSSHEKVLEVAGNKDSTGMIFSDGLGWIADYPEISNLYFPILSPTAITKGGWNWSQYNNTIIETMALKADALVGEDNATERSSLWVSVFSRIEDDAPWAPLYNRRVANVISPSLIKSIHEDTNLPAVVLSDFFYLLSTPIEYEN